jgi:hypothetical protein
MPSRAFEEIETLTSVACDARLCLCLCHACQVSNCRVIRQKGSTSTAGYGFMDFHTHDGAAMAMLALNGQPIPSKSIHPIP